MVYIYILGFSSVAITRSVLKLCSSWLGPVIECLYLLFLLVVVYSVWFFDLCEVALYCGLNLRHSTDIFCRESLPTIKVALVGDSFPCVLYWTECCPMCKLDRILLEIDLMYVID